MPGNKAEALTKTGRYQIVGELGRGSMGVVYQGFDPIIGRTVAIKTMLPEGLSPQEFQEYKARFQREAMAAGVVAHPNIVTVYDAGEDNGILYIAMEFLQGKSLEKIVQEQTVLPVDSILHIYDQVCGALEAAHRKKIVHRDVKPANIMILDNGLVKVTDFGIAKIMEQAMTQSGQTLGTPNYMSPEQVKGRHIDGRSDIFSLGIILYELVTGEKPFGGQNITTVIYKIINENPIPPREHDASIHPGLSYVIAKALAKNVDERYQTCLELSEDLRNYRNLGGGQIAPITVILKAVPIPLEPAEAALPPPIPTPPPSAPPPAEGARNQPVAPITVNTAPGSPPPTPQPPPTEPKASTRPKWPLPVQPPPGPASLNPAPESPPPSSPPAPWAVSPTPDRLPNPSPSPPVERRKPGWLFRRVPALLCVVAFGIGVVVGFFVGPNHPRKVIEPVTTVAPPPANGQVGKPSVALGAPQTATEQQVPATPPTAPPSPLRRDPNAAKLRKQVEAARSQGDVHLAKGDYADAITTYQVGLKLDPSNAQLKDALERARTAEAANLRKQVEAARNEGDVHREKGEYPDAIKAYQVGLKLDPSNAQLKDALERAQTAEAAEGRLIQTNAVNYLQQLEAAKRQGDKCIDAADYEGAINAYLEGLKLDPLNPPLREALRRGLNAKTAEKKFAP